MEDVGVMRYLADVIILVATGIYIPAFITVRHPSRMFMARHTRQCTGTTHLIMGDLFTRTVITTDDIAGDGEGILWKIAQGSFDGKSLFLWINSQRVSGK